MATYKVRGTSHNVIYQYKTSVGKIKQQWESYETELEAIQRKAYIDHLQAHKRTDDIRQAAIDYKRTRAIEKSAQKIAQDSPTQEEATIPESQEDNICRTFKDFMERFLPFHARLKNFSPRTYDSYVQNLNAHIYPYFGDWVMSAITAEAIDAFIDHLRQKPCSGSKSFGKKPNEIPRLSSPTIKKCYNILTVGFPTAKRWGYIKEIPKTSPPSERTKKRKTWTVTQVREALANITDDPILHLAVHIGFVCSLRAGEVVGLDANSIDFQDKSMWITQIVERVTDKSLKEVPAEKIVKIFPKQIPKSKSSLILKTPKTEGSFRKQYLTTPLLQEIKMRLEEIEKNKELFGKDYHDYGLLICQPDGRPIDPNHLCKTFKRWQASMKISDQIEFQGLRKAGQMHKVRLTQNNYQLVAESSGQSPSVLMSNYNEALDEEKRGLSQLVESSFYGCDTKTATPTQGIDANQLLDKVKSDPELSAKILQLVLGDAVKTA